MWKRWGKPQNFFLVNCWRAPIKNKIILIFTIFFLNKKKKNTCRYNYQNLDDMIYSSWDTEKNILKLGILGHFLPFICPFGVFPKNQKSKFWKINFLVGDVIILHICTKIHNHMMYSSWDTEWDRHNFLSFWTTFSPFYHIHSH